MKKKKRRYIDYDYEEVFTDPLEVANSSKIEKLLAEGKIKSVYATKTIKSGNEFEVEIYPEFTKKENETLKLPKRSSKAQRNLNDKNARKKVERLINTNFSPADLWITLTYDNDYLPNTADEALKKMKNYIRRINYKREKKGLSKAKYIYITEYYGKRKNRFHHHLVMDGLLEKKEVIGTWKEGKINEIENLEEETNRLAKYLMKDPEGSKRWCSSLHLKKPREWKSYFAFTARHVKKMVENREAVKRLLEAKYKNKIYISNEIKFNRINEKYYIYARMRERKNE